jgi:hypothetical protein
MNHPVKSGGLTRALSRNASSLFRLKTMEQRLVTTE